MRIVFVVSTPSTRLKCGARTSLDEALCDLREPEHLNRVEADVTSNTTSVCIVCKSIKCGYRPSAVIRACGEFVALTPVYTLRVEIG